MPTYYPAFLNVKDRLCIVIGGGRVAEGKVASLLECGACVKLVSPEVTPTLKRMADSGGLLWEKRDYREGDLADAFLAIAATDNNSVNKTIAHEANKRNVLLNVVDSTPLCSFIAPSVVKKGDVTLAISTGGLSPALARKLREELQASPLFDYAELAPMLSDIRRELREEGVTVHPDHWQSCLNQEILALYHTDKDAAKKRLKESLLQGSQPREVAIP